MMRRRRSSKNIDTGQDSFLDVISNIVGILIILVMIAGVRLGRSYSSSSSTPSATVTEQFAAAQKEHEEQLERSQSVRAATDKSLEHQTELELSLLEKSRALDFTISKLSDLEVMVELAKSEMSDNEKQVFDLKRLQQELDAKLAETEQMTRWLDNQPTNITVLENLPSPISREVSVGESHFRLADGRISHVPFPILTEKMTADVHERLHNFRSTDVLEGQTKPVDDYTLRYIVAKKDVLNGPYGAAGMKSVIELEYCEFLPTRENIGEPVEAALQSNSSDFIKKLSQYRSDLYTVTIWVYPNSFKEFRTVREFLFKHGYQTAARPLPPGANISASPHGTKSTSQ